jgi:nitrate/TMAO reductase-like tetraheme cytochrome c subunit
MKNLKNILVSLLSLVAFTTTGNAQMLTSVTPENSFEVKCIQMDAAYLYFQVAYKTSTVNKKVIKISDATDGELYVDNVDAKTNVQTFKIERNAGQVLIFTLEADKKVYSKKFSINTFIVEKAELVENEIVKL